MRRVSVLNADGHLMGAREIPDPEEGEESGSHELAQNEVDVDPGDLALDGTYKWSEEQGTFFALGHGFGKMLAKPPYQETHILYLLVKKLAGERDLEMLKWAAWYETDLKVRLEESRLRERRRMGKR